MSAEGPPELAYKVGHIRERTYNSGLVRYQARVRSPVDGSEVVRTFKRRKEAKTWIDAWKDANTARDVTDLKSGGIDPYLNKDGSENGLPTIPTLPGELADFVADGFTITLKYRVVSAELEIDEGLS